MSGATYRIDVFKSQLMPDAFPWKAHVMRLSDGEMVAAGVGTYAEEAEQMARELVLRMNSEREPFFVYVGDDGQDAEAPRPNECSACHGTGQAAPNVHAACSICDGTGTYPAPHSVKV